MPESPRWLFIHGREEEAERIVDEIEAEIQEETGEKLSEEPGDAITVEQRKTVPFRVIARTAFKTYPKRGILGLSLFVGQAFIYNAVVFTLGLTLTTYLGVESGKVGIFYAVFAIGNFLGPLLLGRLFDTVGRRPMIAGTYLASAVLLVIVALLFNSESFSDWGFVAALAATFFFASAGASSAYLTVSEIFPMEVRALAIAFFYAIGTAIGGISGPLIFERLASTGDPTQVMIGFLIGAAVMAIGGIAEIILGVRAEQRSLEDIAAPLTAVGEDEEARPAEGAPSEQEERAERRRRRQAQERAGWRRYRTGPGSASWSPFSTWPPEADLASLDREVAIITDALREQGPTERRELVRLTGARYWARADSAWRCARPLATAPSGAPAETPTSRLGSLSAPAPRVPATRVARPYPVVWLAQCQRAFLCGAAIR